MCRRKLRISCWSRQTGTPSFCKPYPDIFLAICEKVGVRPEEALVLEDAQNGVRAALAGGIRVINVPDMIPLPEDLAAQCVSVEESLLDVIPYIRAEAAADGSC